MAGKSAILSVRIVTDAKGAQKGMADAQTGFQKFEAGAQKAGRVAAVGLAAAAAAAVVLTKKAEASATANARLQSIFTSMGDTTGRAADEAIAYAEAMARVTGIETNTIKATQAKLATFEAVSNETARQAGIFDRATQAAADLAAAGFGSMEQNATQLGKALQDPAKGLASLSRSGVTFTKAEQDMIAAMVAAGDTAGAQAVVLAAVEKQVGGTAAATANASDKMAVSWEQAQVALGTMLLPALEQLSQLVMTGTEFVKANAGAIMAAAAALTVLAAAVVAVNLALKAYQALMVVIRAATIAWSVVQWILNASLWANPITWVVIAIAALVAAVVLAYTKLGWFRAFVDASFEAIKKAAVWLWEAFQTLGRIISDVFTRIGNAARGVFDWLADKIAWVVDKLQGLAGLLSKIPGLSGLAGMSAPGAYAYATGSTASYRTITVNVATAGDPVATARAIRSSLAADDARFGRT